MSYAGAFVVFKNVDLQIWHWMSIACAFYAGGQRLSGLGGRTGHQGVERTTLSCDLATFPPFSLLRSRFCCALAP